MTKKLFWKQKITRKKRTKTEEPAHGRTNVRQEGKEQKRRCLCVFEFHTVCFSPRLFVWLEIDSDLEAMSRERPKRGVLPPAQQVLLLPPLIKTPFTFLFFSVWFPRKQKGNLVSIKDSCLVFVFWDLISTIRGIYS